MSDDLDPLLDAACDAARAGGRVVLAAFGTTDHVRSKGAGDWVSDTDTGSEQVIRNALTAAAPAIPVVGEEGSGEEGRRARPGRYWVVDPLDGTTNFLHGFPVVGVSVALVDAGRPVVGVVHAPMLGETYAARAGGGARLRSTRGEDRTLSVSTRPMPEAIVATGFPFRAKEQRLAGYLPVLERAIVATEDLRRAGAASLDLAWSAAGVLDGYFELGLGPWDVAAGAVLVREAGGVVTDWAGDDSAWLATGNVVVGNPEVHAGLLRVIGNPGA